MIKVLKKDLMILL